MVGQVTLFATLATLALCFGSWAREGSSVQSAPEGTAAFLERLLIDRENRSYLIERYQAARAFAADDRRGGIFLDTSLPAPVGRVIIRREGTSGATSCSGAVVGGAHFLTAAHCFCSALGIDARDEPECRPTLASLRLSVFLPQVGLVGTSSAPIVHPAYTSPRGIVPLPVGDVVQEGKPIADLALVSLAVPMPSYLPVTSRGSARPLLASFGTLTITIDEYAARLGFAPGQPIAAGVGQLSRPLELWSTRTECGRYHTPDTLCGRFSEPTVEAGPLQTAAVCQGDSGAPLLQRAADGSWVLVGVTSYYSPPGLAATCLGDRPRISHFVDAGRYAEWVSAVTRAAPATKSPTHTCVSALFASGSFEFLSYVGSITVTAFERRSSEAPRPPRLDVARPEECRSEPGFGLASCDVVQPSSVVVGIESDFAQITLCGR